MGIVMLDNKVLMSGNQMALYIPSSPPSPPPPPPLIVSKGSLVKMNLDGTERQYRVLSVNGNVCKVMGMWDDFTSKYNETSTTTTFGSITAQKYEGSTLDTYLNTTWYNTLSTEAKNAIVPENVVQYCYQYYDEPNTPNTPTYTYQYQYNWSDSDYENADNVGNVTVGDRNVFALDLKDIFDYFGKVCITSDELMTMFWNSTTKVSKYLWLRSSNAGNSITAWAVNGYNGSLGNSSMGYSGVVRPVLNLNFNQIEFTVVDKTPVPLAYKGDILSMDLDGQGAKQYRVLSMNGDVAKVVAMYDTLTSKWNNDTSKTTTMGTITVAKYEGSDIDTYLNTTWYNTLTSTTKAAIVPENVVCDTWYWGNNGDPDYTGTHGSSVPGTSNYTISKYADGILNIGNRNVFALGVQDVIDYLNDSSVQVDTSAILRNVNIWKMFWNDEVSHSGKYLWLRSCYAGDYYSAWRVYGDYGLLNANPVYNSYVVRPALNLNLSRIEFTVVDNTPLAVKGDILSMDLDGQGAKQYRVLSMNGDVAKVMAMYDTLTSVYNATSTTTTFGSTTAQKYADSTLDTYLNTTWYNTLKDNVKAAIVPENVVQYCYQYYDQPNTPNTPTYPYQYQYGWSDSDYDNADNVGNVTVGKRNVFALDLKDIFDYFDKVCITSDELMTLFFNQTTREDKYPWLRSSYADDSNLVWNMRGLSGSFGRTSLKNSSVVRPALNLNLSQVEFTIV